MKKSALVASIALLMGVSSFANAASTGTITFDGNITDNTCNVDVNGAGSDATVTLPTVSANQLVFPADVTGRTTFNMNVSGCELGNTFSRVAAYFQPGASVNRDSGRLTNIGGSAANVELQLLDVSGSYGVINVGNTDQITSMTFVNVNGTGNATLPYAVEYYSTGDTGPGTVKSSVVYNLQYE
jgi:major type 1 subunit fimbrin (pilin)